MVKVMIKKTAKKTVKKVVKKIAKPVIPVFDPHSYRDFEQSITVGEVYIIESKGYSILLECIKVPYKSVNKAKYYKKKYDACNSMFPLYAKGHSPNGVLLESAVTAQSNKFSGMHGWSRYYSGVSSSSISKITRQYIFKVLLSNIPTLYPVATGNNIGMTIDGDIITFCSRDPLNKKTGYDYVSYSAINFRDDVIKNNIIRIPLNYKYRVSATEAYESSFAASDFISNYMRKL